MVAACALTAIGPVLAQPAPKRGAQLPMAAAKADPQEKIRYQIAVMESVLETAVQRGATAMTRQLRSVAPEMLLMGGTARARGFRLDGYGLFFAVDVPTLQRSVIWTWQMLDRDSAGTSEAIQALRSYIKSVADAAQRRDLEQAVRRLEVRVSPYSRPGDTPGQGGSGDATAVRSQSGGRASGSPMVPTPVVEDTTDPDTVYSNAVKDALIEAMLDYSQALQIGADESLTVAARADNARGLGADEQGEWVTIFIRVKGADLQAFYAGRMTRDEARKRVEVREY
jgi:hypothetical protein